MEVVGKVIELNRKIEGSSVELSDGSITLRGRVAAVSVNEFLVEWEDGVRSVENKSDYELVVEAHEKAGQWSAQPMGAPMRTVTPPPNLALMTGMPPAMPVPPPSMPMSGSPSGVGGTKFLPNGQMVTVPALKTPPAKPRAKTPPAPAAPAVTTPPATPTNNGL